MTAEANIDDTDRAILNALQGDFPLIERPFAAVATTFSLTEDALIQRIDRLIESKVASRFGPMFNADRLGGAFCLCAMAVPEERFDAVAAIVNAYPEVAHNYARRHALNMWFVLATETEDAISEVRRRIEEDTALPVLVFPKLREFFIGLRVAA